MKSQKMPGIQSSLEEIRAYNPRQFAAAYLWNGYLKEELIRRKTDRLYNLKKTIQEKVKSNEPF